MRMIVIMIMIMTGTASADPRQFNCYKNDELKFQISTLGGIITVDWGDEALLNKFYETGLTRERTQQFLNGMVLSGPNVRNVVKFSGGHLTLQAWHEPDEGEEREFSLNVTCECAVAPIVVPITDRTFVDDAGGPNSVGLFYTDGTLADMGRLSEEGYQRHDGKAHQYARFYVNAVVTRHLDDAVVISLAGDQSFVPPDAVSKDWPIGTHVIVVFTMRNATYDKFNKQYEDMFEVWGIQIYKEGAIK